MFSSHVAVLHREASMLKGALKSHEALRDLVLSSDPAISSTVSGHSVLSNIKLGAPTHLAWKTYDHCAGITRLYAIYEKCVTDITTDWLDLIPTVVPKYAQLPESIRNGHRTGVATILSRFGGERYRLLTESRILGGISDGVRGGTQYALLPDAFFVDDHNFRKATLDALFSKLGIPSSWKWICSHGEIVRFIQMIRGGASTVESELKMLVDYRNEAAHGDASNLLSPDEICKLADFVVILCDVICQLFSWRILNICNDSGNVEVLGKVIRKYSSNIVGIHAYGGSISVGDKVLVWGDNCCFNTELLGIQVQNVARTSLSLTNGLQVGLRLHRPARPKDKIVKLIQQSDLSYQI